jgi:hypothetical protein
MSIAVVNRGAKAHSEMQEIEWELPESWQWV